MNTKPIIHAGIALFLLGSATLTYQGVSSPRVEKVADANRPPARAEDTNADSLSPLAGGLLVGAGVLLIALGVKKSPSSQ